MQAHAKLAAKNATYQSPGIQNALISVAGDLVKETVSLVNRIKKANSSGQLWQMRQATGTSGKLTVVIRYLLPDEEGR